jgi:tRNA pseudouridine13 synthase
VKLKRLPEDFQVEELTEFAPVGAGDFAIYRVTKRGLGTREAIDALVQRWNLSPSQVSYGGLKDKHAISTQHISIRRGPHRSLQQTNLSLEYLGQAQQAFGSGDVSGNRFQIVLRSLSRREVTLAEAAIEEARRDGLPNYFDDQRFGSLGDSGEFVARAWIAGDYERACWLALADSNPLDRPRDRQEKAWLRELWGRWPECKARMSGSQRQPVVSFLCNRPTDFRGAFVRIRQDLRSLFIAAFQSHLWNRILAAHILSTCPAPLIIPVALKVGGVPFFGSLSDATRAALQLDLPLPSSRIKLADGPVKELVDRSLGEVGLTLREIRVKYPRDSFFSKGTRPALSNARTLTYEADDDELYPRQQKLRLQFDLPRGSYATIVVKRIAAAAGLAGDDAVLAGQDESGEDESEA